MDGVLWNPRPSKIPKILALCVTNRERQVGILKKCRAIAKAPELGSKYNGRMTTRLHFEKGRAAAQTTPSETAVFLRRNEVGHYAA
jgi:hypothetical protein